MKLDIVYQNEDFIALNKPAACLSTPPRFPGRDQRKVLGREVEARTAKKVYPIHRLDYEVSGLILYALNAHAHRVASQAFENRKVKKYYVALTEKPKDPESLSSDIKVDTSHFLKESDLEIDKEELWKCKILRGKKRAYIHPKGKNSSTTATLLESSDLKLKWLLQPHTGRSHQLRFELFRHGCPIIGDHLYGSQRIWDTDTIALQSVCLSFESPKLQEMGLPEKLELPKELLLSL